jgi:N-acetylmuramoyl-L-alanine amidase
MITSVLNQDKGALQLAAQSPIVMGARIGRTEDRTRFVIELSDPVAIRTFTLTNPDRVIVDMPAVQWHLNGSPPGGIGAVKDFRYGLFRSGNSRIVINLRAPVQVSDAVVLPPEQGYGYRVVVDLLPTTPAMYESAAGWPADLKARESAAERQASLDEKPHALAAGRTKVIIIDPGHGGVDPGTNAVNGSFEKDVVLDVGLRLARVLGKTGYTVHMTRETDVFVPLSERVRIARSWHADLFISLHADSNPDRSVNGLSVYTLSERGSDKEAAELASKENQSDVVAGVDLSDQSSQVAPILIDLAQRDTLNRSNRFALAALDRLGGTTDILEREPHRSAAFVVLESPDVPAVLIELGYLSNADDASKMESAAWRDGIAEAIARAVDRQFSTQASLDSGLSIH